MSSSTVSCPHCGVLLAADPQMAGQVLQCPSCSGRLRLPPVGDPDSEADEAARKKPQLLSRSGNPAAPEPSPDTIMPDSAGTAGQSKTQLPTKRRQEIDISEEMRRMAAAGPPPPDSGVGTAPAEGSAPLPAGRERTALPVRRVVEDLAIGELAAKGRPRRPSEEPDAVVPPIRPLSPLEPIPLKPEAEFAPSPVIRTSPRKPNGPTPTIDRSITAKPVQPELIPAAPVTAELPAQTKEAAHRINPDRALHFKPRHELETEPELTESWGEKAAPNPMLRRTVVVGVILCVLGVAGLATWAVAQFFGNTPARVTKDRTEEDPMKNYKAAQQVIEQFLAADTPEKKAAFVRHPEETLPRMKTFYARQAQPPRKVKKWELEIEETSLPKPDSRETIDFITTQAELEDFRVRQFALEIMPDGSPPRLDWEHHVSWSEIPWQKFLETASEQACDFRVRITPDDYFIYAFQDAQKDWLCYRLRDPGNFGSCWAYCRFDSAAGKAILQEIARARRQRHINENGDGIADCILKLRFPPEGRKHNQAVIEAFVHESWVIP